MYDATSASEMELAANRRLDALKGGPRLLGLKGSRSMIHVSQEERTRRGLWNNHSGFGHANDDESDFDDTWSMISVF